MKKVKSKLPIGEKVWFYNKETKKIESDYLWGVVYSRTPLNASHDAGKIHISKYILGEEAPQRQVYYWLCFFTWTEVLNFIAENCELPLMKEELEK